MQNIREYILFHEISSSYSPIYDPESLSKAERLKGLAFSLSNTATEIVSVQQTNLKNKQMFASNMNRAYEDFISRYVNTLHASQLKGKGKGKARTREQIRYDVQKDLQDEEKSKSIIKAIENSNDAKLARMYKAIGDTQLVIDSLSSFQNIINQVGTIYDILGKRAKNKNADLESAEEIYDRTYKIQKEGEEKIKELNLRLNRLGESFMYEGFFSNLMDKIKRVFMSKEKELEQLKNKAKRI